MAPTTTRKRPPEPVEAEETLAEGQEPSPVCSYRQY